MNKKKIYSVKTSGKLIHGIFRRSLFFSLRHKRIIIFRKIKHLCGQACAELSPWAMNLLFPCQHNQKKERKKAIDFT